MTERVTEKNIVEYEAFLEKSPYADFMQSSLWAGVKPMWKWCALISRDRAGNIKGSMAFLIRRLPLLPLTMMYSPRGPVCDPHDEATIKELITAAKPIARENRACLLKADPDVEAGDAEFMRILLSCGFSKPKTGKNFEGIQPRFVYRLPLSGRTEEELLSSFESKTRYNIRLAERKGIAVRVCGEEEAGEFSRLMRETGERDNFTVRTEDYFRLLLKSLAGHARLYIAYYGQAALSGAITIFFAGKAWYLYGASSNEHRNKMPNYLMQWEMIKDALALGCHLYDFRGVSGDMSEENPLYGLYRFKRGFSGRLVELCGETDLSYIPLAAPALEKGAKLLKKARGLLVRGGGNAAPSGGGDGE